MVPFDGNRYPFTVDILLSNQCFICRAYCQYKHECKDISAVQQWEPSPFIRPLTSKVYTCFLEYHISSFRRRVRIFLICAVRDVIYMIPNDCTCISALLFYDGQNCQQVACSERWVIMKRILGFPPYNDVRLEWGDAKDKCQDADALP